MGEDRNGHGCQIKIERPIFEHGQLRQELEYHEVKSRGYCNIGEISTRKVLSELVPSVKWLSRYKWRKDLVSDVIAGITVAIMHIPQGMAYGLLGNVPPVVGIYMAFFPVLVYFFLGTSKHTSMGTFAIVCLMTGKTVLAYSDPKYLTKTLTVNQTLENAPGSYTPIEVATTVTFTVALFQLAMYLLRLGVLSTLLSETLVSGFITGAAVQVVVSQLKDLLGLNIPRHKGLFTVINTFGSLFQEIHMLNWAALTISFITILVSTLNNEVLKPVVAKKSAFPVPMELIAIIVGTAVSKFFYLEEIYGIRTVGDIPSGLPSPHLPQFSLVSSVLLDSFMIAIVSYSVTLSMALIFAQKLNYQVDANQELLAQGLGNVCGSFFSCMPVTASLSRSTIQQVVGGKTQIASLVSCSLLLVVLFWIGPFFESLPRSVLASVIVVALKGMLMEIRRVGSFWQRSKLDAIVWIATFLTVVFISIEIGLLTGFVLSLGVVFILSLKSYTCLLGAVPLTDIYLNVGTYKKAVQVPGIKIFQYCGGVNFATKQFFRSELLRLLELDPQKELLYRIKLAKYVDEVDLKRDKVLRLETKVKKCPKCIVLDFSCISHIDPSGVTMLEVLIESFQKIDIPIYIAACSEPVYQMVLKCGLLKKKCFVRTFLTIHDAVECANEIFNNNKCTTAAICP